MVLSGSMVLLFIFMCFSWFAGELVLCKAFMNDATEIFILILMLCMEVLRFSVYIMCVLCVCVYGCDYGSLALSLGTTLLYAKSRYGMHK